ncbi:MAG: arylamine N-acetyltransferase [Cellvibrionaceae bacterium]|jgi:arylamine N-acetyltransferase
MISTHLSKNILQSLGLTKQPANIDFLDQILHAYTRSIPWESATRNVKRVQVESANQDVQQCPRWPEEFWALALEDGTGGTCFETNLSVFAFLNTLGYNGYLTINNMTESIGCHTAIVVLIDGEKWLFDAGYPLECVVPLSASQPTYKRGKFLDFQATPQGDGTYEITRLRHPKPYVFTLIDTPVSVEDYKQATANDYRPEGNFNESLVINKTVDEQLIRFSTRTADVLFESFTADPEGGMAVRQVFSVEEDLAQQLANIFKMPISTLSHALEIVQSRS